MKKILSLLLVVAIVFTLTSVGVLANPDSAVLGDVNVLRSYLGGDDSTTPPGADVNGDGWVNSLDMLDLRSFLAGETDYRATSSEDFEYTPFGVYRTIDGQVTLITELRITRYTGSETHVVIPGRIRGRNVTEIFGVFNGNQTIESVIVPHGVRDLHGFSNTPNLYSVTIPNSVTRIRMAFYNTPSLKSITIPNSVTVLYPAVFRYSGLEEIEIPGSIRVIPERAFMGASNLKVVRFNRGTQTLLTDAFRDIPTLEKIHAPYGLGMSSLAFTGTTIWSTISITRF